MSNHNISIFDIPHLVSGIGSHLGRDDYAACTLVNRTFYEAFRPILWRNLYLDRPDLCSSSTSLSFSYSSIDDDNHDNADHLDPNLKEMVTRNCQLTRRLHIRATSNDARWTLISTRCTRLTDLNIHVSRNFETSVADIVSRNPHLQRLLLTTLAPPTRQQLAQLTKVLAPSTSLTELRIEFRWRPQRGWLQYILQNLPRNLQQLVLKWRRLYNLDDDDNDQKHFPIQTWPQDYPSLQVVQLSFDATIEDEITLGEFLNRCPALQSLAYPNIASEEVRLLSALESRTILPDLDTLYLGRFKKASENQWRSLITAMRGRIRHFATSTELYAPIKNVIPMITHNWWETLESLRFQCFSHIFNSDIQLILTSCPRLKHFDCMWTVANHSRRDDEPMVLDPVDWVCKNLEELHFMVADNRAIQTDDVIMANQEAGTAAGIEQVYKQIGQLTKLQTLTLGWRSAQISPGNSDLDMSLGAGLGHMEQLKALKTLDVNFLPRLNIGLPEIQWMVKNWPSLSTITGYGHRHKSKGDVGEPEHVTWLRNERPKLKLN
ncbi:hypothetical protein BGX31_008592 [Mortierella sp. GBA43]|nr:hypothetical protein BGX31_008592 [Mortierella sp. GBA43]